MIQVLRNTINQLRVRIRLLFTRSRLIKVTRHAGPRLQTLQVEGFEGETLGNVEHAQPYGLSAYPLAGAEPFLASVLGQRDQCVAVVVADPRGEPSAASGEVVVWSAYGQVIRLRQDGGIDIIAPSANISVTAPEASVNVAGNATVKAGGINRIEGKEVEIHAEDRLSIDCGGHGDVWTPDHKDSYVIGATGQAYNLHPDEVP